MIPLIILSNRVMISGQKCIYLRPISPICIFDSCTVPLIRSLLHLSGEPAEPAAVRREGRGSDLQAGGRERLRGSAQASGHLRRLRQQPHHPQ